MAEPSETELLAACRRGDAEAWDRLFDEHYPATARFVFQLSPQWAREDVEEICQETFLAAIQQLHSFHGQSRFQTWLFRIATNKSKDYRQKLMAAKRGGRAVTLSLDQADPESGLTLDPPSTRPGPDALLVRQECLHLVGAALERLGDPCQEIIALRYFADLS
jgi:RNA polymerase sigma-70 factor (ECF subfamily)